MAPQKGKTNNPRGRPPKSRALTALLAKGGGAKYPIAGEKKEVEAKALFVKRVWQALATGEINFENGRVITLEAHDYIALTKLVLNQIDGPPKAELDLLPNGGGVKLTLEYVEPRDIPQAETE